MAYFLVKREPGTYSWGDLVRDGRTVWDGIRSFEARNNLRSMKQGDRVLFYHSGKDKAVVGTARVVRQAYPDPKAAGEDWSAVDLAPEKALARPVTLATIKADAKLSGFALVKRSRLSVVQVTKAEFERVLSLAGKKI